MPKNIYISVRFIDALSNAELDKMDMHVLLYLIKRTWYKNNLGVSMSILLTDMLKQKIEYEQIITSLDVLKAKGFIDYDKSNINIVSRERFMGKQDKDEMELIDSAYNIWKYWNSKGLVQHSKKTIGKNLAKITSAVSEYGCDNIEKAIDNYIYVLRSDQHYFTYEYGSIFKFLNKIDQFLDTSDPRTKFLSNKPQTSKPKRSIYQQWDV